MSSQTNDPHDIRLKEVFGNREAFFSLLKDCVRADWIDRLDAESLKPSNHSFILQDFGKKEADVVYEATLNRGRQKVIFYVLLELQSRVDYRMPYRLLLYITEILRYYYKNADPDARKRRDFKFPAVIPIVFFSGSQKWTVPTNVREMFDGHRNFGDSLLNFNYALVDAKGYNDESVKSFHSRLLRVIMMFEKSANVAELCEVIKKYKNDIEKLDDEELRIIGVAIKILSELYGSEEAEKISETLKTTNAGRVSGMLSNLIANEKKREKQLAKQLREEHKIETAKRLFEMGLSLEQVAKGSDLSIEKVEKIKADLNL